MPPDISQPFLVPPDSGRVLKQIGVTHKLISQQTGGAYYLFEFGFGPESGNRLHVHRYEDEVVYVLEGTIQIRLGDGKLEAIQGGIAHLPKTIPHALYNPLKTPSRYVGIAIPGGMEYFFDELELAYEAGTLDDALHREISHKYGIEWLEQADQGAVIRGLLDSDPLIRWQVLHNPTGACAQEAAAVRGKE